MNPILQIKFFSMNILLKTKRLILFPQSQPFSIVPIATINTIKNPSHHKLQHPSNLLLPSFLQKNFNPSTLTLNPSSFPKTQHSFLLSCSLVVSQIYSLTSTKKKSLAFQRSSRFNLAATYFPTWYSSIIGDAGLNFSVRNGKRCSPAL